MSGEVETLATALLLAMDGDFLPGAGLSIGNTGQDVPLDQARPKEVAHWAAGVAVEHFADFLAVARAEGKAEGRVESLREAADAMAGGQHSCFRPQGCVECGRQQERDGRAVWLRARADREAVVGRVRGGEGE